jgi:hypothetical protein
MKRKKNSSKKMCFRTIASTAILTVCITVFHIYSCGGGVVPYIPSGTGASSNSSTGQFFLFDKGVTSTMLDYRAVQPLFKNIVNSGNERKDRNLKIKISKQGEGKKDTTEIYDSTRSSQHNLVRDGALPVLNLHKLH